MTRALKVLHVMSGDLWAGAEVQAFTLISHLARMRDTEIAAVILNKGLLSDRLQSIGVRTEIADESELGAIRIFARLRGIVKRWRPDVVHTHRQKENVLGSLASRVCSGAISVRTTHGKEEHTTAAGWRGVRRAMVHRLDRWCGRSLQRRIIAVTTELGVSLSSTFPRDKIVVIENGVDADAIRLEARTPEFRKAATNCIHIGIAGRLVAVKRVDLFLETAALLLRECTGRNWKFHVFGDGPERAALQGRAYQELTEQSTTFHGHRQDIVPCISGLDVLVICSDHEGMPMVALEAAALEVPTVAHAAGGLVDIVPREFLVHQHDAFGYRDGILRALCSDGREIAKRNAREKLPKYSAQLNAERVRAMYDQVVAEKSWV